MSKLLVIGLDCVPPWLLFDHYADVLPNLSSIAESGSQGFLRSSEPAITVPAWTCMTTGRDPGELGIYGFRNRAEGYDMRVVDSSDVKAPRIWDELGTLGHSSAAYFIPLTSPSSSIRGEMVSCFLNDGENRSYPSQLIDAIEEADGEYIADVADFRDGDLQRIFTDLNSMTEQHFSIAHKALRRNQTFS